MKISKYAPSEIEKKWQKIWRENKIYSPDLDKAKKPFYNLMMFPYPSAEGMHVGNMYAFTGSDIYGRFKRMQGFNVFEPIGLDGFGIHSENYAIKVGRHPKEQAKISEKNFYRQLHATGNGFDWSRKVETYDPEYYKWTQWIFIQLFKAGLAYRKKAPVNFCPSCKTVLADEQVIDEKCERCSSIVEKKDLEQWFFKITTYADRLLNNLTKLDWTPKVKIAQKNWIGKSEGLIFTAPVKGSKLKIQTFSAHFQAFRADTFVVIAPDHSLLEELIEDIPNKKEILDFAKKIVQKRKSEGRVEEKNPEGIFTGKYIVDPVGNGDLPIWVANYAIKEYGTGIVKCSVHDERDFAFAKKYGIRLKPVLFPKDQKQKKRVENLEECYTDMVNGYLTEPDEFASKRAGDVRQKVIEYVVRKGLAKPKTQYHLRDWLISRQRYWGPPIPIIYCRKCWEFKVQSSKFKVTEGRDYAVIESREHAIIPVPEKDLPVFLPDVSDWKPKGTGKSPLANHPEFYKVACPECGAAARRETDVSDTFLDSAWYYLGYLILGNQKSKIKNQKFEWDKSVVKKWLPVDMYIGGAEHSVLHLLYSRFLTMVFKDLGLISFEEPFTTFRAHGLLISGGAKMSKSKGNVVIPDQYIKKYGADTLRAYLMFAGPYEQGGDFRDTGIEGMHRFLKRVWVLVLKSVLAGPAAHSSKGARSSLSFGTERTARLWTPPLASPAAGSPHSLRMMHRTIKKVTEDIENLHYNTAISALMEYYNEISKIKNPFGPSSGRGQISKREIEVLLLLLAPFTPHMTEELWERIKNHESGIKEGNHNSCFMLHASIHVHSWPSYDPRMLEEDEATIVVQVDGKVRDTIKNQKSKIKDQSEIESRARESERVKKYLEGKKVKKVVYVEGKIINFVIS